MAITLDTSCSLSGRNSNLVPFPGGNRAPRRPRSAQAALNDEMDALQAVSSRICFARNETIFADGDPADYVFKIVEGAVRLCKHTVDGRRQVLDFMLPGDMFGFMDSGEYTLTAEAVSDVTLISYPRAQLERLGAENPSLRQHVLGMVSQNLLAMQQHVVVLGCQNARERVSSFLLRLSDRTRSVRGAPMDLPMGRQDLADHLGLTIETVCRSITELRRANIVAVPNNNQIVLNDLGAMRSVIEGAAAA